MSNVMEFGAAGDGVQDDTEAIQHAVHNGEGRIKFPPGTYRLTKSIHIPLNERGRLSICGSGGSAKIVMAGPGPAFHIVGTHDKSADPNSFRPEVFAKERYPTVLGIEIEGAHPDADGIRIEGTMQSTLSGVVIRNVATAVHITKRARNVLIDACHFYFNSNIGVHLDEVNLHQCIISSSHISYCRRGGIRIDGGEIRNLHITGNDIEYNNVRAFAPRFPEQLQNPDATGEIYFDAKNGSIREVTICSNTIQATLAKNGCNIRLIGKSREEGEMGLVSISGNLIGNEENNLHFTRVWGVTVAGNQIYGATHRNVLVEDSQNVVISGNMFGQMAAFNPSKLLNGIRIENSSDCVINGVQIRDPQEGQRPIPAIQPDREGLIELVNSKRVNISGTQINDPIGNGLLIADCEQVMVSNVQISDHRPTAMMKSGVLVRGVSKNNVLNGCQILNAISAAVIDQSQGGIAEFNTTL